MRVSLITPPFDIIKEGYGSKVKNRKYGYWPPLGIGYLAASLKAKGHEVELIDCPPLGYSNDDAYRRLMKSRPGLIGVSTMTATKTSAYSLIKYLKKRLKTPIILGGPHPSIFPDECLQEVKELDAVAVGEGEGLIVDLVDNMEKGQGFNGVAGVHFREGKKIVKNPERPLVHDLDTILPPAWELYDMSLYQPLPLQYHQLPIMPYVTSRGCPWRKCTFCFEAGRGGVRYRRHSPERVVKDIKELMKEFKVKEIAFWDDNFMINQAWVVKFCKLLKKNRIKLPWQAYGRVNTITEEMLKESGRAGCWNIFYGLESGNQDLLDNIHKGITLEQVKKTIKWTHDNGIESRGSFMLALPGETPEKAIKTIKFAIKLDLTFAQFLPTYPEAGTILYDDALKKGKIMKQVKYKGRTEAVYVPDGYKDKEEVMRMVRKAYRMFYFRPSYFLKHMKNLRSWKMIKQYFEAMRFIAGIGFR